MNERDRILQAGLGQQDYLIVTRAASDAAAVGQRLEGRTLVPGTYECDVDITGLAALRVFLTGTGISGTNTPSGFTTMLDGATSLDALSDSGAGGMVNGTRRTLTLSATGGARLMTVRILVNAASGITIGEGQVCGK